MTEPHVTQVGIAGVLLLYLALYIVITTWNVGIQHDERKTALVIGGSWAVSTFVLNYVLFRAGVMSFLPWINNFLHTFGWIGVCLTLAYLGVRRTQPMWKQFVLFATFSLVVKVGENIMLGTWELDHFFRIFKGNTAYIVGWSLADGLYPPITLFGLRLVGKFIRGLDVT